jgi:hypothetical protein
MDRSDVRALTRGGYDWTDKYRRVVEACSKLKCRSALIDGEVIVQDKSGLSDFAALRAAIEGAPHRLVMFAFDSYGWVERTCGECPSSRDGRSSASCCRRTSASQFSLAEGVVGPEAT